MNTPYKPTACEQEALDKYNLLPLADQKIIDDQVMRIRQHFEYRGFKGIPNNTCLLGLLMKVGEYCARHDIKGIATHPYEAKLEY